MDRALRLQLAGAVDIHRRGFGRLFAVGLSSGVYLVGGEVNEERRCGWRRLRGGVQRRQ